MMISIGDKHFIESEYISEILKPADNRANVIAHAAAGNGRLINATDGRRIRSIIILKSKHIVLSALDVKTLKSKIGKTMPSSGRRDSDILKPEHGEKYTRESKPAAVDDRRIEADRRHFSYTHHIPERRSGIERRSKNDKFRRERKFQ